MKKATILAVLLLVSFAVFSTDLEITELANYHDGNWVVVGLIKNNSLYTYSFISLGLTGTDDSDNLVHTDTTYAFSPVPSGGTVPFNFLTSPDNASDIARYSVTINSARKGGSGTMDFSFSQPSITERNDVFVKYSGRVTNENTDIRSSINIAFLGFDTEGKLVFFDDTYPDKTTLSAGGSSVFDFLVPPHMSSKIERYRLLAYAG